MQFYILILLLLFNGCQYDEKEACPKFDSDLKSICLIKYTNGNILCFDYITLTECESYLDDSNFSNYTFDGRFNSCQSYYNTVKFSGHELL